MGRAAEYEAVITAMDDTQVVRRKKLHSGLIMPKGGMYC